MATPKKKTEATTTRVAARPQSERRVEMAREPSGRSVSAPSFEEVSRRAFEIWERNGRMPGQDLENWLQAEAELRSGASA